MQNAGRMWASSMGLSFVVEGYVDTLNVTAGWGRYAKSDVLDEAGNPHRAWSRQPDQRVLHPRLDRPSQRIPLIGDDPRLPGVFLAVETRPYRNGKAGGAHVVELGLVNGLDEPPANKDTAWLFQAKLVVTAAGEDEQAVFCPIDDPQDEAAIPDTDPEDRLLYRKQRRHALGRNVAVHASVRPGERHAHRLETR